jgi:hypothetical protein
VGSVDYGSPSAVGRRGHARVSPAGQVDLGGRANADAGIFRREAERRVLHQDVNVDKVSSRK